MINMFYNAQNYNTKAILQQEIAKKLIYFAKEDILKSDTLLDIGCGTGFLGAESLIVKNNLIIHGVDSSLEFLKIAQTFYNKAFHVKFEDFTSEIKYDVAISSMCLQWFSDINLAIKKASQNAKIFYFAIPESESLNEITQCFTEAGFKSPILQFKTPFNLKPFAVQTFEQNFSNLLSALKSFNDIGIKNPYAHPISHSQIRQIQNNFCGKISWKIGFYKYF